MAPRLLVTGAGGFVGRAVVRCAVAQGSGVVAATRAPRSDWPTGVQALPGLELRSDTEWRGALDGMSAVVHCAARVHVLHDAVADPLAAFREVNTAGTLALARQAAAAGVRRFVFVSSIGVNGAETTDRPFGADDAAAPHSPYAVSKHEAELGLQAVAAGTGMEVVIVRPPLVYGPGAPGNFAQLLRALHRGLPLPLGATGNRRSFVALDNLVDLLLTCVDHPAAANQTLLVSDAEDLSTTDLLRRTALALGRPARLLPLPGVLLRTAAELLGKRELGQRLFGSLQVDISKTRELLGWNPPIGVDQGLQRTAAHFLATLPAGPTA
jgi:nucleoside-diphosphate-sugar epimerase